MSSVAGHRVTPAAAAARPLRILLYSHDSLGLGHARRNLALAHAFATRLPRLTGRPVTGMLLTGLDTLPGELPAGFDSVSLPGIRKGEGGYAPRHVTVPMEDVIDLRSQLLTAAVTGFAPDLLVVDRHAYGVDNELRDALLALRRTHPEAVVVLGLREVLDERRATDREWATLGDTTELRALYDEIWVYGDEHVHDVRRTGEVPAALQDLVRHTGYLAAGRRWVREDEPAAPYVLTTVGGGADGLELCLAAARAVVPRGYRHVVVTGPQMDERDHREVCRVATGRTEVVRTVPDGLASIRGAAAVISMAGYNTVSEVMSTDRPALLVPRCRPRREQSIRADALAQAGAVTTLAPDELTPERLSDWLARSVGERVSRRCINLRGLSTVARFAAALVPDPTRTTAAGPAAGTRPSLPTDEVTPVAI